MITLIGFRCTHSNVLSHEVLIRPSRPETQTSQLYVLLRHLRTLIFFYTHTDIVSWWFGAVATPVPIPNTEVKRSCGDDSLTGESS